MPPLAPARAPATISPMTKLSLTCACGQEMVVPESAVGKIGLCPGCGVQINITPDATRPYQPRRREGGRLLSLRREAKQDNTNRQEAWRQFAAAVDLFNTRRYAEALAILDSLLTQFPGNPNVQIARDQCMEALHRTTTSAYSYDGESIDDGYLHEDLVKSVILDKMLNGTSDDIQLKAAELAARVLGLYEAEQPAPILYPMALPPAPAPEMPVPPTPQPMNGHAPHFSSASTPIPDEELVTDTVDVSEALEEPLQTEVSIEAEPVEVEIIVPFNWKENKDKERAPGSERISLFRDLL